MEKIEMSLKKVFSNIIVKICNVERREKPDLREG